MPIRIFWRQRARAWVTTEISPNPPFNRGIATKSSWTRLRAVAMEPPQTKLLIIFCTFLSSAGLLASKVSLHHSPKDIKLFATTIRPGNDNWKELHLVTRFFTLSSNASIQTDGSRPTVNGNPRNLLGLFLSFHAQSSWSVFYGRLPGASHLAADFCHWICSLEAELNLSSKVFVLNRLSRSAFKTKCVSSTNPPVIYGLISTGTVTPRISPLCWALNVHIWDSASATNKNKIGDRGQPWWTEQEIGKASPLMPLIITCDEAPNVMA